MKVLLICFLILCIIFFRTFREKFEDKEAVDKSILFCSILLILLVGLEVARGFLLK